MAITNSIKVSPYDKSKWTAYGPQPDNGQQYVAPDGTVWHVDGVQGGVVRLWTINGWGGTSRRTVNEHEFKAEWKELVK